MSLLTSYHLLMASGCPRLVPLENVHIGKFYTYILACTVVKRPGA